MKHYHTTIRLLSSMILLIASCLSSHASSSEQDKSHKIEGKSSEKIEKIHKRAEKQIKKIQEKANKRISKIMARAWKKLSLSEPIKPTIINPLPTPQPPEPPILSLPINREIANILITAPIINPNPSPKPLFQIKDNEQEQNAVILPTPIARTDFNLYGCQYPIATITPFTLTDDSPKGVANAWDYISENNDFNILISDVINATHNGNLIGWAALEFTHQIAKKYATDESSIAFLHSWLMIQLGYDTRLANVNNTLYMLFGTKEIPIRSPERKFSYAIKDGRIYSFFSPIKINSQFYIHDQLDSSLEPISLFITSLPKTNGLKSNCNLTISTSTNAKIESYAANEGLLDFFSRYPQFMYPKNTVSQWLNYATTPLEDDVSNQLENQIRELTIGLTELDAVNLILSTIQAIPYEYDDTKWGIDRPYFAQETLHYSKGDCEDHAILFTRLIKNILGLPCALIYYPGHLAAAVEFSQPVNGDYIIIDNHRMTICDPTYNRPAGFSMPDMLDSEIQAIIF